MYQSVVNRALGDLCTRYDQREADRRDTQRVVLITGPSPGSLGKAAALAITRSGPALLILASRSQAKLDVVADGCRKVVAERGDGVRSASNPIGEPARMRG